LGAPSRSLIGDEGAATLAVGGASMRFVGARAMVDTSRSGRAFAVVAAALE